jgi:hypothetical protein
LIESIYIDVANAPRSSRYTLLIEQLAAAERAKHVHEAMTRRVLKLHDRKIQETRAELEKEGERLRSLIKVAGK